MSAAVAEKIEFEKINSAPSSGETGRQNGTKIGDLKWL